MAAGLPRKEESGSPVAKDEDIESDEEDSPVLSGHD